MGFYYGSSAPPPEDKGSGLKEALLVTWAVIQTLALPLGILFLGLGYLVLLFFLFAWQPLAGLAGILVVVGGFVARGLWEWRHPPELK